MDGDMLAVVKQKKDINYKNASVGVHAYTHKKTLDFTQINRLQKAGYPVIVTEFAKCCGLGSPEKTGAVWHYLEKNKISWVYLDLRFTKKGYGNYGDGIANPKDWLPFLSHF